MTRRSYGQYCGAAHALDLIGERWTLLIVRELLTGPKRYKDLHAHLPGIGTNLLAARLKHLEEAGISEKRMLPAPASTEAYDLTDHGRELEPVLVELARWGYRTLPPPEDEAVHFPGWQVLAMKAIFSPEWAEGVEEEYEFRVDGEVFFARITGGRLLAGQGAAQRPTVVLETGRDTFLALIAGTTTPHDAARAERLTVTGDAEACARCTELLDVTVLHRPDERTFRAIDLTGRPSQGARRLA